MKKSMLVSTLMFFLLISCHQLDLSETEDETSDNSDFISEITLDDGGESERIYIGYSELNPLLVKVPVIQNSGYFKLTLSPASAGARSIYRGDIAVRVYDDRSFIGDSLYTVFSNWVDGNLEFYFLSDGLEKNIVLYHDDEEAEGDCIFNASVESIDYEVDLSLQSDDTFLRSLSPGIPVSATVPYWGSITYSYEIKSIIIDQEYELIVSWDKTASPLPIKSEIISRLYEVDDDYSIEELYRCSQETGESRIFRIISDMGSTGTVDGVTALDLDNCYTGDTFQVNLREATSHVFSPDPFEPDQGPVAASIDSISGSQTSSAVHTFINDDIDWVKWQPWGSGEYKFYLELDDAWYIDGVTEGIEYKVIVHLVSRNGAEIEVYKSYSFTEPPVNPIISSDILEYTLETDTGEPLYFEIIADDEISYRIIAEKL